MRAFILAVLAGHASALPAPMVQPSENGAVGFRVLNQEANSEGHYEAVEMVVSAITEMVRAFATLVGMFSSFSRCVTRLSPASSVDYTQTRTSASFDQANSIVATCSPHTCVLLMQHTRG